MNIIYYRGCPLQVLRSNPWVREVVLDESNQSYKWTKWTISAVVTYNPEAITYAPSAGGGGNGPGVNQRGPGGGPDTGAGAPTPGGVFRRSVGDAGGPSRMPADTDVAIRRFFEFPRGNLVVFSTDMLTGQPTSVVLRSPAINPNGSTQACDANNGPFCKVNSIQEVAGERLWQIHLVFETYIREDSLASGQVAPILVSNQWSVSTGTNWQHLTTRIIEGIVHFRADRLINTLNPAEAFRSTFAAFTVPSGFQRTEVLCRTLASGNQVAYRVVDTDQPFQKIGIANKNSVRLEYSESSWVWVGSAGRALGASISNLMSTITPGNILTPFAIGGAVANFVRGQSAAIMNELPKRYKTCTVRAWGNRDMRRPGLTNLALSLSTSLMGTRAWIDTTTSETIISYHSAQMMAQVQTTSKWSFSEAGGITSLPNLINLGNLFANPDAGTGDFTLAGFIGAGESTPLLQIVPNANPQTPFPYDSGTRGTWSSVSDPQILARLTTQVLESLGDQNPGAPP